MSARTGIGFRRSLALLTLISLVVVYRADSALAQSSGPLKLVKAELLTDFLSRGVDAARFAVISPDGKTIATSEKDGICLYPVDTPTNRKCTVWPSHLQPLQPIYWSPDSKHLAYTEDTFRSLTDSDIWIYDTATGTLTDRTDDNFFGSYFGSKKITSPIWLDYLPVWDPSNGDLYFFRNTLTPDENSANGKFGGVGLYRLKLTDKEPTLIRDLSTDLPGPISIFPRNLALVPFAGTAQISPDGKKMAVLVADTSISNPQNGIWVLDLAGGAPEFIATSADGFQQGLPTWNPEENKFNILSGLAWTTDGGIVFGAGASGAFVFLTTNFLYANSASHAITPLYDLSKLPSRAESISPDQTGRSPISIVPKVGLYLPNAGVVVTINGSKANGTVSVYSVSVANAKVGEIGAPVLLGDIPNFQAIPGQMSSGSNDETRMIMFGYLLTLSK